MGTNGRTGRKRHRKRNNNCTEKAGFSVYDPESITLLKWAKQNGIYFGKLCPAMFTQTGRGLMTNKNLIQGDKVISVPGNMLITLKTANESKIGIQLSKLQTKHLLSTKQMLCVFLLYEKYRGRSSFWYPYIATLPKSFNTPAYFSEEEIQLLPCDLQNECCVQLTSLKESYKGLKGCLEGQSPDCLLDKNFIDYVTFDEFMWAWFVVNTRSVYKAVGMNTVCKNRIHGDDAYALAPVKAGFNKHGNKYEIFTISSYKKGGQVFINYGPHDNRKLLVEYGFILPKNVHNVIPVPLKLLHSVVMPKISKLSRGKKEVILRNRLNMNLFCSEQSGLSWTALVLLRVLAMDEESFKINQEKVLVGEQMSNELELKVEGWRQCLLWKLLHSYEELDRNDEHLLRHGPLSRNAQVVLQLRNQEKQILSNAMKMGMLY
ncbi:SET domain-containing protein 4 [Acropora cervicornis]|uniref:SET domain-containing protein 4 n=1 Tax=Acropora cervicornis TaxID=6130 RepID=A0AAD9V3M7_ACRCE|nr:SET domain-containing protein 4 [Acropora cervicornis]